MYNFSFIYITIQSSGPSFLQKVLPAPVLPVYLQSAALPLSDVIVIALLMVGLCTLLYLGWRNYRSTSGEFKTKAKPSNTKYNSNGHMEKKSPENDSKTASIIHEINQPLSAMTMLADLTMNEMNEPPTEERDETILSNLKEIVSQGQRCSKIIEKMKTSNNADTATFEPTNINALIIRTMNEIQFYDGVENINIRQNLEHNLPNIVVDEEAIQRVLTNLFRNAIDAMDNSSKKILTVSSRKTDGGVNIEVADTGCGIDKIDKQKIFEANYTTKGKDGMGIGLSVCKDIITNHNGALTVTSELNQGTSFRVFLPFNKEYKQNTVAPNPKQL